MELVVRNTGDKVTPDETTLVLRKANGSIIVVTNPSPEDFDINQAYLSIDTKNGVRNDGMCAAVFDIPAKPLPRYIFV